MSSLCHKGAVEKLDHGVFLFVFCVTESKTWHYIYVNKETRRTVHVGGWRRRTFHWQPAEMRPLASQAACGKTHWHPEMKTQKNWKTNSMNWFCVKKVRKKKEEKNTSVFPKVLTSSHCLPEVTWWHLSYGNSMTTEQTPSTDEDGG